MAGVQNQPRGLADPLQSTFTHYSLRSKLGTSVLTRVKERTSTDAVKIEGAQPFSFTNVKPFGSALTSCIPEANDVNELTPKVFEKLKHSLGKWRQHRTNRRLVDENH